MVRLGRRVRVAGAVAALGLLLVVLVVSLSGQGEVFVETTLRAVSPSSSPAPEPVRRDDGVQYALALLGEARLCRGSASVTPACDLVVLSDSEAVAPLEPRRGRNVAHADCVA